jgi:hypothetical protein
MPRVKQASKQKRTTKAAAVKALGAAGLSFSLVGSGASASTMPTASIPQSDNTPPNQRFVLSEEEIADVSLATFYVFDRENVGSGEQLARGGGGCGGCGHGGGGCGGCGHGGGGCGGCAHGGGGCAHVGGGCAHVGGGCAGFRGGGRVGFVGCRGCGGFRGCRGFRGCGCGGCGFGFGFDDDIGFGGWGDGGCCASWGACRLC